MLQSLLLVSSVCLDTFVASIAYGASKIKVPILSIIIINLVCSSFLGLSMFFGASIKPLLPTFVSTYLGFTLLFSLGICKLFESILKSFIQKTSTKGTPLTFKIFDFKFVLDIYANEVKADFDNSKVLSSKESFYLALALSLDSLAVGFGSSLGSINYVQVILLSFLIGVLALIFGTFIGKNLTKKVNFDLSWLSGAMLVFLAFFRFLK